MQEVQHRGRLAYAQLSWGLVIFLLSQVALPILFSIYLYSIAPSLLLDRNVLILLTYACMYLIGFPLLLYLLRGIPDCIPLRPPVTKERIGAGKIFALYTMLYAISNILVQIIDFFAGRVGIRSVSEPHALIDQPVNPWLMFFLAVVVAPVMEEVIFRFLPYRKVSGYGVRYYVLWTAIAFGLFHINFVQSVYAGAMGIIFALVMFRTGSLRYSIILHVMINLTSGLGLGGIVLQSGNQVALSLYGLFSLVIFATGVVVTILFLRRRFFSLRMQGEGWVLKSWKLAFLNTGYILFVILCLLCIFAVGL